MNDRRKAMIAKLHIARQQLGMADDSYRSLLGRIAPGKSSSTQLTLQQLDDMLAEMQRMGFVPKASPRHGRRPMPKANRAALVGKVEAMLAEARRPWAYADAMAKRMFDVDKVDWLDAEQLQKLVAALTYDAKRHGRSLG